RAVGALIDQVGERDHGQREGGHWVVRFGWKKRGEGIQCEQGGDACQRDHSKNDWRHAVSTIDPAIHRVIYRLSIRGNGFGWYGRCRRRAVRARAGPSLRRTGISSRSPGCGSSFISLTNG